MEAWHCSCSGNCARKLCEKRRNRRRVCPDHVICLNPRARGASFCVSCKCEIAECPNRRYRQPQGSRWCIEHHEDCSRISSRPGWYMTPYGSRRYDPDLSITLQIVFRCGFALLKPEDYLKFQTACRQWCEPRGAGSPISGTAIAVLFFVHAAKWPPAILRFLQELPLPAQAANIQGENIIAAWYRTVKWASGQQWQKMHAVMSATGRMHASTGIAVHSGQLGLFLKRLLQIPPKQSFWAWTAKSTT